MLAKLATLAREPRSTLAHSRHALPTTAGAKTVERALSVLTGGATPTHFAAACVSAAFTVPRASHLAQVLRRMTPLHVARSSSPGGVAQTLTGGIVAAAAVATANTETSLWTLFDLAVLPVPAGFALARLSKYGAVPMTRALGVAGTCFTCLTSKCFVALARALDTPSTPIALAICGHWTHLALAQATSPPVCAETGRSLTIDTVGGFALEAAEAVARAGVAPLARWTFELASGPCEPVAAFALVVGLVAVSIILAGRRTLCLRLQLLALGAEEGGMAQAYLVCALAM